MLYFHDHFNNLISAQVKIVNREREQQQAANEPFGQSGTRCVLVRVRTCV